MVIPRSLFILSVLSYRSIRKQEKHQDSPNIEFAKKYKINHNDDTK